MASSSLRRSRLHCATDTLLVSLMHVNNEIGVVQDVAAVGRLCRERGVLMHVDAAQSAGKVALDVQRDCIDLLSLTAHKMHGPKGIGALCMRREPRLGLVPLQFGGGQERGLRSGTLPTHQVVGMGATYRIAQSQMLEDMARITRLREQLWSALLSLPGVQLNGDPRTPCRGHPQRHDRRGRGREPALRAVRPGRFIGLRVRHGDRRAVIRAACARAQRPARPEFLAL